MSQSHLTTKYRPQRFGEVAGQEAVKAVLSRAASEDHVAPAYLFSGTRGVGKTTIARIMAKALNCETAPAAEPCNECRFCRQITSGACVDVVEVDAASNRGIDDARRLKEEVGYAPIEARYKVFIIDEAHMLTKEAFNALLKTLEEPPGRVCFILATTEPHKFPATIVSRCQHYSFKRLTQAALEAHLIAILEREAVEHEAAAVALVARRGAGSVRDSMSLLSQVLALGGETLTADDARLVLGLAGQEVFFSIMEAVHEGDLVALSQVLARVLDQGLDLGFFLRELTASWRNMFLLKQSGEAALPLVDLPESEARTWLEWAGRFDLARIHASWQLTMEGQKKVLQSLEPALALELLLFNLATLPRLLRLDGAPAGGSDSGGPARGGPRRGGASAAASGTGDGPAGPDMSPDARAMADGRQAGPARPRTDSSPGTEPKPESETGGTAQPRPSRSCDTGTPVPDGPRTWEGFLEYMRGACQASGRTVNGLMRVSGSHGEGRLVLTCSNETHREMILSGTSFPYFQELATRYFGPGTEVEVTCGTAAPERSLADIRQEMREHPAVRQVMEEFGARIVDIRRNDD